MKIFLRLFLIISIFVININAKERYTKENITKHLETLFAKNIRYEKKHKSERYNCFKEKIRIYYEFSTSTYNLQEKIKDLKEISKKFESLLNIKIQFVYGKPRNTHIKESKETSKITTTYTSLESLFENYISYGFYTRNELFNKLKVGYWRNLFFGNSFTKLYPQTITYIKQKKVTSLGFSRSNGNIIKKSHHLCFIKRR